jgi:hypothetical protein
MLKTVEYVDPCTDPESCLALIRRAEECPTPLAAEKGLRTEYRAICGSEGMVLDQVPKQQTVLRV